MIPLEPGRLVAVRWEDDDGRLLPDDFRIVEVVSCIHDEVRVICYRDRFSSIPASVNPATLTRMGLHAAANEPTFAVPLSEFASWAPTPVARLDAAAPHRPGSQ